MNSTENDVVIGLQLLYLVYFGKAELSETFRQQIELNHFYFHIWLLSFIFHEFKFRFAANRLQVQLQVKFFIFLVI